ncbi:hypothetical protein PILCRDRAFT_827497 [Piloderma croceum F 1598]|uniref:Uncharacterized protein n=1 Tax=Piloderma croceum (strain F 1598) TaxID=765440 RepID=A0A0C3ERQ5_PILCF|nr:hypothetical protein PILCRDRAFT_827497 [Piloderma croceum F 1598]
MGTTLYISLERTTDRGKFHWAIIVEPSADALSGFFKSEAVRFPDEDNFVGCVRLPEVQASVDTLRERFAENPAAQGNTYLPYTHTEKGWSCALWVMRELTKLEEEGLIQLGLASWSDVPKFYIRVCDKGIELQEMTGGMLVNGVRVIDLI